MNEVTLALVVIFGIINTVVSIFTLIRICNDK